MIRALRLNPRSPDAPIEATINEVNNRLRSSGLVFSGSYDDRSGADLSLFHLDGKLVGPVVCSLEILGDLTTASIELHHVGEDALASGVVSITRDPKQNAQEILYVLHRLQQVLYGKAKAE